MDSGYPTFLNLLQQPNQTIHTLPDDSVHGAIAHYAQVLPLENVPLFIRSIVTSPGLWTQRSWQHLAGTQAAIRQAVRAKLATLQRVTPSGYIFSADLASPMNAWVDQVLSGLSSIGSTLYQLHAGIAVLGGLALGLDDTKGDVILRNARYNVDRELASYCAEAVHFHASIEGSAWGSEFAGAVPGSNDSDAHTITICLLAQVLATVPSELMGLIDLRVVANMCLDTISRMFGEGHFLDFATKTSKDPQHRILISNSQQHLRDLRLLQSELVYDSLGRLCHLLARCTHLLAPRQLSLAWMTMERSNDAFEHICGNVARAWASSPLSAVREERELAPETVQVSAVVWEWLKTLLFSTLIVMQSHVALCAFHRPPDSRHAKPSSIVASLLRSMDHLSFVGSQFGGVAADGSGLVEQKRVLFGSLDILSSDLAACEFLLSSLLNDNGIGLPSSHPVRQSRAAFFLACAEQLVPCLSDQFTEYSVLPFARQFLDDPTHRETFESSHSVILAVFANNGTRERSSRGALDQRDTLTTRLAPFYLRSLVYNSPEGRLSSEQLQLALSSLVKSLSASKEDALAWLCIETLVDAIHSASAGGPSRIAELGRLRHTLTSTISAVNLSLLPRLFSVIEIEILSQDGASYASDIADQVLSRVSDAQKDYAVDWWMGIQGRQRRADIDGGYLRPTL